MLLTINHAEQTDYFIGKRVLMLQRKIFLIIVTAVIIIISFALPEARGQLYQYTDMNGNIIFTDNPPAGVTVKKKRLDDDGVYWSNQREADYSSYKERGESQSSQPLEKKRNRDYSSVTVVMYMADWCGYCKQAREYIHSLGANLVEHDIERDPDMKAEMKEKSGGSTSVPLIDIDGSIIRGYNPSAIKTALDLSVAK